VENPNSFFECSSSSDFEVGLANQTWLHKWRIYTGESLHVLLPYGSPPVSSIILAIQSATTMPVIVVIDSNSYKASGHRDRESIAWPKFCS
jgi:hypothetical protein